MPSRCYYDMGAHPMPIVMSCIYFSTCLAHNMHIECMHVCNWKLPLLLYKCNARNNVDCASVKSQLYNSTMGAVAAPYRPRSIVGDQLGGDSTASNSRKLSQPAVMPSTLEVTRNRISNRHSAATQHEHTPSLTGTASLIERRLMANGFGRTEHSSSAPKVSFTPADASVAIGGQPPLYHAEARRCLSQDHINVTRLAPDRLLQSPPRIST